jgi:hypothetical protein
MRGGLAIGLLTLAAGCVPSGGDSGNRAASVNRTTASNGVTPASAPVPDSPLVGRWADVGASCANPVEIFGNGTFRAVDGSRGHWRSEGDRLTVNIGARVYNFRLLSVTRDRIETIDGEGQRGSSVRCP